MGLGSAIVFGALANGDIDVYVDYSGTIWANVMRRTDVPRREPMLAEMARVARRRARHRACSGALGFENAYGLAMRARPSRGAWASRRSPISRAHAAELTIGADLEFFARPEWNALQAAYGLRVREPPRVRADVHVSGRRRRRSRRDLGVHERRAYRGRTISSCSPTRPARSCRTTRSC